MANGSNCSHLSEEDINHTYGGNYSLARGLSAIVAFLGFCLTLLLILFFQRYKSTLQRLFLYLTLAMTGETLVNVLQIHSSNGLYCEVVGFLNQYSLHVVLLFMVGATLYLSRRVRKSSPSRRKRTKPTEVNKGRMYCEIAFIVFSLIFPLIYNWIPFVIKGSAYGGQPWCWFKVYKEDCSFYSPVFLILGYLPCIVVLSLCSILVLSIIAVYIRWAFRFREARQVLIHEAGTVILFAAVLLLYLTYYCALLAIVIVFKENKRCNDIPQWLLWCGSVLLPVIRLMLPVSFITFLYRFRREFGRTRRSWVGWLKYTANKETENTNPHWGGLELVGTYHKSEPENIPSTTCYPYLVEFTDEFLTVCPRPSDDMCLNAKPLPLTVMVNIRKRSATI